MRAILGVLGSIPRPTPAMGVALLALLIAASGVAVAAIPSGDGTITACRDNKTGTLRIIDTQVTPPQTCYSKETTLSWKDGITGKVADSDKLDGQDSTDFLGANQKAADSDKLDGQNSDAFLGASETAVDSDKLDGLDSDDFASSTHDHESSTHDHDATYVNETDHTKAAHDALDIDADTVDGKDSTAFLGKTEKAADSDKLDGQDSTDFYAAGSKVADSDHADQADQADSATSAGDANTLDGKDSTEFLGKTEKAVDSDKLDGIDSSNFAAYKRTVVVSPTGTDIENGTALKDALAGINDASATNPYLLKIEPGIYDLGSLQISRLDMQSFVDVEGSGEGVTTITSSNPFSGTVVGAANSELRWLTVKHTGGPNGATAILNFANNFRVTNVTAAASGEGPINEGLNLFGTERLSQVTATASGASARNTGVNINGTATLDQVTATGSGGSVDGSRGVEIRSVDATAVLSQVTATASGGPFSYGVLNAGSTQIHNSRIAGGTATLGNYAGTMLVGASHLSGPPSTKESGTTLTCAGVYDENYAFSTGPDCP